MKTNLYPNEKNYSSNFTTCPKCKKECKVIEVDESFTYSGTHCTEGKAGTHNVPVYYVSDCCEAVKEDYEPHDEPDRSDYLYELHQDEI